MGPVGARIFSLPFILIGALVLYHGVKSVYTAKESESWPTTPGKVISSTVDSSRGDKGSTYHAEVLYQYTANGQTQLSHDISFGSYGSSNPSHAQSIVNKYPTGSEVTVHYSPTNPSKAVLETGIMGPTFFLPGFGAVFLCAGLIIFTYAARSLEKQRAASTQSFPTISIE